MPTDKEIAREAQVGTALAEAEHESREAQLAWGNANLALANATVRLTRARQQLASAQRQREKFPPPQSMSGTIAQRAD